MVGRIHIGFGHIGLFMTSIRKNSWCWLFVSGIGRGFINKKCSINQEALYFEIYAFFI